jgi:hypothetical protein
MNSTQVRPGRREPSQLNVSHQSVPPIPSTTSVSRPAGSKNQRRILENCACHALGQNVCRMSNKTRKDWKQGDILQVPMHVEAMDPKLARDSPNLRFTDIGPVFSKRRMMVVLHVFHDIMECLPLYTNGKKGLENVPKEQKVEWVPVVNYGSERHLKMASDSTARHLSVRLWGKRKEEREVDEHSHVHFTESVKVDCAGHIWKVGQCDEPSFQKLHDLRIELNQTAREEPW